MSYPWEFSGTVIDGPDRGKRITCDDPYYRTYVQPALVSFQCKPWELIGPETTINHITYKWSRSLDQWCMIY